MVPKTKTAVVLISGGINSCVTASLAAKRYNLCFLHLSYGQRVEKRELKSYKELVANFNDPQVGVLVENLSFQIKRRQRQKESIYIGDMKSIYESRKVIFILC